MQTHDVKVCPDCAEEVKSAALVCRFCGYRFTANEKAVADEPPARDSKGRSMPPRDMVVWFVGVPLIWLVLAFSVTTVYEDPFGPLFDLWLLAAIGSWLLRRPYGGWAIKWRWAIVVVWLLIVISEVERQSTGTG